MKIAIQQALQLVEVQLGEIKRIVQETALLTAQKTLEKLQEMSPELASSLVPEFKTEPKFDSQFKLTIKGDGGIPVNKRGSGVRRLILLNFFRAEAERRRLSSPQQSVIYAFEEPETSQHPDHQEMLIKAFLELSSSPNTQVLLTTHTPNLAGLIPLESLRYVKNIGGVRTIEHGRDDIFQEIIETLGLLPNPIDKNAKAILLVEGKGDVHFVKHTSLILKEGGYLTHTLEEKKIAIVPMGGCGTLKHWAEMKLANQFGIPYCVLIDSDKGTPEEARNLIRIQDLNTAGIKAYSTKKREPENYIISDVIESADGNVCLFGDLDDAKKIINKATGISEDKVLEIHWTKMNLEQIRETEKYIDEDGVERYEFTEMFNDFLSLSE